MCARLKANGYQALLAGGCVRDLLMNRRANDFDVATDATPDQVQALWPNAVMVGKAFGVCILPFPRSSVTSESSTGFQVEVATFRQDLEYRDGRHPEGVRFSTPEEDAKRRDFTVNALFFDVEMSKVIDFVGGQEDIKRRLIRTVGSPEMRFAEDKLRILRAVRFSAQLGFSIQDATYAAVCTLKEGVSAVSRERIRDELMKLLKAERRVVGLKLLLETELLEVLFPEWALAIRNSHEKWLNWFACASLDVLALLTLFVLPAYQQNGRSQSFKAALGDQLKLSSQQVSVVWFALKHLTDFAEPDKLRRGELMLLLADPASATAMAVTLAMLPSSASLINGVKASGEKILGVEMRLPEALINGADAQKFGLKPGAEMGQILREGMLLQLEERFASRDEALAWLGLEIQKRSVGTQKS